MCQHSASRESRPICVCRRGLGSQLLAAAARRCLLAATQVGGVILIIEAKGERAARWYAGYGAVPLKDRPLALVLPLTTFTANLTAAGHL